MQRSLLQLLAAALAGLACLEIEACVPAIIPAVALVGGSYVAEKSSGDQREPERPDNILKGCFADSLHDRDMGKEVLDDEGMTHVLCRNTCKNATLQFMGLQNGTQCYCSDTFNRDGGKEVSNSRCDIPCGGDILQTCGGDLANSVFLVSFRKDMRD